jgi:GTPase SAR1 family protein
MVLFSFFDNVGTETEENNSIDSSDDGKKFKIIFVGDAGVGKTQIINKFVNLEFDEAYNSTIGVDFISKIIKYYRVLEVKFQNLIFG